MSRAGGVAAAAELEPQLHEPLQGHDGPPGRGGRPERPGASRADPRVGGQVQGPVGMGSGTPSRPGAAPRSDDRPRCNESIPASQTGFATLGFFPASPGVASLAVAPTPG